MAGLSGFPRNTSTDPRLRRAGARLRAAELYEGSVSVDEDGRLSIAISTGGGLETLPGGVAVKVVAPLELSANGVQLNASGANQVLLSTGADAYSLATVTNGTGITWAFAGTLTPNLQAAQAGTIGGVLITSARTDSSQDAVTLTAVDTTVTDPADTPADADALRDDLVANALAEIRDALADLATRDTELETAVETLADEFNDLLAKLRTAGTLAT